MMRLKQTGAEAIAGAVAGARTGADAEATKAEAGVDVGEDTGAKTESGAALLVLEAQLVVLEKVLRT